MELEYAIDIKMVLDIHGIKPEKLEGAIISSVVPQITYVVKEAAEKILKKETLVIGPGVKNGLNILMDNPAQLGSDLVANAVAGIAEYKAQMMIFDLGTATTVSVIDEKKNYIGGMIYPGVNISLNALTENASQLLRFDSVNIQNHLDINRIFQFHLCLDRGKSFDKIGFVVIHTSKYNICISYINRKYHFLHS